METRVGIEPSKGLQTHALPLGCLLSLIGVPLTGGFFGKSSVLAR
jgi:NADH:ubiquinone oxidoreductase subunit 2 (subunit N)